MTTLPEYGGSTCGYHVALSTPSQPQHRDSSASVTHRDATTPFCLKTYVPSEDTHLSRGHDRRSHSIEEGYHS